MVHEKLEWGATEGSHMILNLQIDIVYSGLVNTTSINELCVGIDILRCCGYRDNALHVSRYALESPVPPADLIALSPGYRVPPDLATVPYTPLAYTVCAPGGRNVGSNVRNDIAGSVT